MSEAHGNLDLSGGGTDPDVERVLVLDDGAFLNELRSNVVLSPLRLAVQSSRSRCYMNDVATVKNWSVFASRIFCFVLHEE